MKVRRPYVAGSFYPGSKDKLKKIIEDFLNNVKEYKKKKNFFAFISPHAGYSYSGQVAARVYNEIEEIKDVNKIILIGVSHNAIFDYAAIDGNDEWETPLGNISCDKEIIKKLIQNDNFNIDSSPHDIEHSLEVQVPFIQVVKPKASIVPVLIGSSNLNFLRKIADKLFEIYNEDRFILIASSDMYHGYSYEECVNYDERTKNIILEIDHEKFYKAIDKEAMACGAYAITVLLRFCELLKDVKAEVLDQTNSARVTYSYHGYVVGYLSMGFYK